MFEHDVNVNLLGSSHKLPPTFQVVPGGIKQKPPFFHGRWAHLQFRQGEELQTWRRSWSQSKKNYQKPSKIMPSSWLTTMTFRWFKHGTLVCCSHLFTLWTASHLWWDARRDRPPDTLETGCFDVLIPSFSKATSWPFDQLSLQEMMNLIFGTDGFEASTWWNKDLKDPAGTTLFMPDTYREGRTHASCDEKTYLLSGFKWL